MQIKYYNGTVFNIKVDAIVNTVNTVGFMGAGLALEMSLRFPDMYEEYKQQCNSGQLGVGKLSVYESADQIIINFPTKQHFKYPSNIKWIEQGLIDFVQNYKKYNIKSVAFPKLGTLNGGLNWEDVHNLMIKYLSNLDIEVYICLDQLPLSEGKEKEMVDIFNSLDLNVLKKYVRLTEKQIINVVEARPIKRFFEILKIQGIGISSYKNILI